MTETTNLAGTLLVAIPNTAHSGYVRSVMLVTGHWSKGTSSVVLNRPFKTGITVGNIMYNAGIAYKCDEPVFEGGPDQQGRIQFVHSLDWQCAGTKVLNEHIGVTVENSILTAIAQEEGPRLWRCIAGHRLLGPGFTEGELRGEPPWEPGHRWLTIPATIESTFIGLGDQQWLECVNEHTRQSVNHFF